MSAAPRRTDIWPDDDSGEDQTGEPLQGISSIGQKIRHWWRSRGRMKDEVIGLSGPFGNSTQQEQLSTGTSRLHCQSKTISSDLMADECGSDLDIVVDGPLESDGGQVLHETSSGDPSLHPSVESLLEAFPDEVQRHQLTAGDQWVVWVGPERIHEILTWLKEDGAQAYDMMSDVTGVDYGGGRPVEVVYQMFSTTHGRALRIRCPDSA